MLAGFCHLIHRICSTTQFTGNWPVLRLRQPLALPLSTACFSLHQSHDLVQQILTQMLPPLTCPLMHCSSWKEEGRLWPELCTAGSFELAECAYECMAWLSCVLLNALLLSCWKAGCADFLRASSFLILCSIAFPEGRKGFPSHIYLNCCMMSFWICVQFWGDQIMLLRRTIQQMKDHLAVFEST